jgi:uncharacterized SAM-binding protein YcdF (DUF218 family)
MYFGVKKFLSQFLMPMPLVCECLLLGLILTRFTQYKKTGRFFTLLSLLIFLLCGYGFGRTYLYNLERRYPSFEPTPEQCEALRGTPVVVLGQGMPETSDLPLRYQNNYVFDRRLFEGVRVAKLIPESQLVISMAGEAPDTIKRLFLDEYMALVNFPTNRVFMFTTARDTSEEAACAKLLIEKCANARMRECANRTSNKVSTNEFPNSSIRALPAASPIPEFTHSSIRALPAASPIPEFPHSSIRALILATSASHIPRAMKIFQKAGMEPIAAPCDYTDVEKPANVWKTWYLPPLPNGRKIDQSERACYEWLGNLYESLF